MTLLMERELGDGRSLYVYSMLFTFRLCIGHTGDNGYNDAYCYPTLGGAVEGFSTWDGEGDAPDGWIRHIGTGRRRNLETGEEWLAR